jgi:hypothetical protein
MPAEAGSYSDPAVETPFMKADIFHSEIAKG